MADDTIERLEVPIEANTRSYTNAMVKLQADTQRAIAGSTKAVASLNERMVALGAGAQKTFAAFGIGFGLSAFVGGVKSALDGLKELSDSATKAGVSAETLQVFRKALEETAGDATDADGALIKFNTTLGTALNNSTSPAAKVFQALGVSIRDAGGHARDSDSVFNDLILKLASIKSPAQAASLAAELFGKKAGPEVAAALRQSGGNLRRLPSEADRYRPVHE